MIEAKWNIAPRVANKPDIQHSSAQSIIIPTSSLLSHKNLAILLSSCKVMFSCRFIPHGRSLASDKLGLQYDSSLVPRPYTPPVFDHSKTGGAEGLRPRLV